MIFIDVRVINLWLITGIQFLFLIHWVYLMIQQSQTLRTIFQKLKTLNIQELFLWLRPYLKKQSNLWFTSSNSFSSMFKKRKMNWKKLFKEKSKSTSIELQWFVTGLSWAWEIFEQKQTTFMKNLMNGSLQTHLIKMKAWKK